jgi:hypothetical protein
MNLPPINLPSIIAYSIIVNSIIWILLTLINWWPKSLRLDHGFYLILLASIMMGWFLSVKYRLSLQTSTIVIVGYILVNVIFYFI